MITLLPSVLILDGEQRSALAAARSLGSHGIDVTIASCHERPLAAASRYCQNTLQLPSPAVDAAAYVNAISNACGELGIHTILPMTDASTMLVNALQLNDVKLACPPRQTYESITRKDKLIQSAVQSDVPVPRTIFIYDASHLGKIPQAFVGKVVIKPARSWYLEKNRLSSTAVMTAESPSVAIETIRSAPWFGAVPCLVQEFIAGHGAGVCSLYDAKGSVCWFAHRRLREKPPRGGVSVLCESVALDRQLREYSERLLDGVNWFGPAMVEFRISTDGTPYLMEINGRFWGSLQLSIDCGIDFPWLLYQITHGNKVEVPQDYPVGRRLRWLLGDFDRLLLQIRGKGDAKGLSEKINEIARFLSFFDSGARLEILRRNDMAPFRAEVAHWFRDLGSA